MMGSGTCAEPWAKKKAEQKGDLAPGQCGKAVSPSMSVSLFLIGEKVPVLT